MNWSGAVSSTSDVVTNDSTASRKYSCRNGAPRSASAKPRQPVATSGYSSDFTRKTEDGSHDLTPRCTFSGSRIRAIVALFIIKCAPEADPRRPLGERRGSGDERSRNGALGRYGLLVERALLTAQLIEHDPEADEQHHPDIRLGDRRDL